MKEEFNDSLEQVLMVIKDSAANEIAESKALKIPITYIKDNQIVKEYFYGRIEVLETLESTISTKKYYKGQKLYASKKS